MTITMCTQLFSCPLCAQPSFDSLDSLRIGLVSVATRPLACPICSDTVLGIDKLTIHLFGHTISANEERNAKFNCTASKTVVVPMWNSFNEAENFDKGQSVIKMSIVSEKSDADKSMNSVLLLNDSASVLHVEAIDKPAESRPNIAPFIATVPVIVNGGMPEDRSHHVAAQSPKDNCVNLLSVDGTQEDINQYSIWSNDLLVQSHDSEAPNDFNKSDVTITQPAGEVAMKENVAPSPLTLDVSACSSSSEHFADKGGKCNGEDVASGAQNVEEPDGDVEVKEKTQRCNICGFTLPDRSLLILHKQLVHMIPEKDCNAKPEDLLKNYPCHLCSKVFKMRGSLMVHMRVAHTGGNLVALSRDKNGDRSAPEGGYNCPTCGKNFKKEQHVTQHLKTHDGKQWECDICSKMFTTKYFLKKHKRLHSGEMPYKCTICDKSFTFQQSFHKHRLYHKDDKPHTCTVCGKSFKELSTLHNHERIHTGEKPFACETCGKCFRQRVSYLVHRRIHTGAMPYTCASCGKSFRYKVSQRTHKCSGPPEPRPAPPADTRKPEPPADTTMSCPLEESNKYVLIVNSDGQPTLTREIDLKPQDSSTSAPQFNSNSEVPTVDPEAPDRSSSDPVPADTSQDLFSLMMSPMHSELPSPSAEMQHLRLSSPGSAENFADSIEQFGESDNLQKDIRHAIDGILSERNQENSSLATINEESLKELLYGINKSP